MWFCYVNNIMVAFGILLMKKSLDILSQLELTHRGSLSRFVLKSTCFLLWILEPPKRPENIRFHLKSFSSFFEGVEWELEMYLGPKNSQYFHISKGWLSTPIVAVYIPIIKNSIEFPLKVGWPPPNIGSLDPSPFATYYIISYRL